MTYARRVGLVGEEHEPHAVRDRAVKRVPRDISRDLLARPVRRPEHGRQVRKDRISHGDSVSDHPRRERDHPGQGPKQHQPRPLPPWREPEQDQPGRHAKQQERSGFGPARDADERAREQPARRRRARALRRRQHRPRTQRDHRHLVVRQRSDDDGPGREQHQPRAHTARRARRPLRTPRVDRGPNHQACDDVRGRECEPRVQKLARQQRDPLARDQPVQRRARRPVRRHAHQRPDVHERRLHVPGQERVDVVLDRPHATGGDPLLRELKVVAQRVVAAELAAPQPSRRAARRDQQDSRPGDRHHRRPRDRCPAPLARRPRHLVRQQDKPDPDRRCGGDKAPQQPQHPHDLAHRQHHRDPARQLQRPLVARTPQQRFGQATQPQRRHQIDRRRHPASQQRVPRRDHARGGMLVTAGRRRRRHPRRDHQRHHAQGRQSDPCGDAGAPRLGGHPGGVYRLRFVGGLARASAAALRPSRIAVPSAWSDRSHRANNRPSAVQVAAA